MSGFLWTNRNKKGPDAVLATSSRRGIAINSLERVATMVQEDPAMGTQPGEALPGPHRSQRALTALARLLASLSRPALRTLCTLRALPLIQGWASAALAVRRA